ncbi:MAG: M61 family metallopeptidase [Chlorobiales bacterium]|nr:M61 family metallopeptidase [Chlorobiales bacterium]
MRPVKSNVAHSSKQQSHIEYSISFDNRQHHEAEISVTFNDLPNKPLQVRMSRSSPGRYSLHEFAKNVYNLKAADRKGKQLHVRRPNPHQWNIEGHDGHVVITYSLFGNRTDGTYTSIDKNHAHLNIPATFVWARGLEKRPVRVKFAVPESEWRIASQLVPTKDPQVFEAPNLQYFMDSPVEIGPFEWVEWQVNAKIKPFTVRLAMHHDGTLEEIQAYAEMINACIQEEIEIFGEPPQFDYGTFTFIVDYLPYVEWDGMEHRNSTILTNSASLKTEAVENLRVLVHEFFHAWNVERLRPKSLEPFDFENENLSDELWFGEGITNYYDRLVLRRAGIISIDKFAKEMSGVLDKVLNTPSRRHFSPVDMSRRAPFADGASFKDPLNHENIFISYYTYGAAIALALDLILRSEFKTLCLDDFMKLAWKKFGKTEKPFTNQDLQKLLADLTGDKKFASRFFADHIFGSAAPEYDRLLGLAGLFVRRKSKGKAWLGQVSLAYEDGKARIKSGTEAGSPIYLAGLDRSDMILSIGEKPISSKDDFDAVLEEYEPGDQVILEVEQHGKKDTIRVTLQEDPTLEIVPYEQAGLSVTNKIKAFRDEWLRSKVKKDKIELKRYCQKCRRDFAFEFEYCPYDGELLSITPSNAE